MKTACLFVLREVIRKTCLLALLSMPVGCLAQSVAGEAPPKANRSLLQMQVEDVREEIRNNEAEIKHIKIYAKQISLNLEGLDRAQPAIAQKRRERAANLKKVFDEFRALPGDTVIDPSVNDVVRAFEATSSSFMESQMFDFLGLPSLRPPSDALVQSLLPSVGFAQDPSSSSRLQNFEKLLRALGWNDDGFQPLAQKPIRTSLQTFIDLASSEILNLEKQQEEELNSHMTSRKAHVKTQADALEEETRRRQSVIDDQKNRLSVMLTQIAEAEKSQASTDSKLTYAVYAMILSIIGLFALLRVFPDHLAKAIIMERTMIELLSMGFLLLTIIILGTGNKMTGEALSALLGTIAGYIFGRREGEVRAQADEIKRLQDRQPGDNSGSAAPKPDAAPSVAKLPAPVWKSPQMFLPSYPEGMAFFSAHVLQEGDQKAICLGQTTKPDFNVPLEKLQAGHKYDVWFVGVDQTGKSIVSETTKISI